MLNRNMPENIYHSLQEAVKDVFGENAEIVKTERMYGGDINDAYRVSLAAGEKLFVKTNSINNAAFFQAESAGLSALGAAEKIGVPKILGMGIDESRGFSFLALEYIERSPRSDIYLENFGHQLAELHRAGYLERKKLYDLYHLLNHLNLFGAAYLGSVMEIIDKYAGD